MPKKIESPIKRTENMIEKAIEELNNVAEALQNSPDNPDHEFKMYIKNLIQDAEISVKISLENLFA